MRTGPTAKRGLSSADGRTAKRPWQRDANEDAMEVGKISRSRRKNVETRAVRCGYQHGSRHDSVVLSSSLSLSYQTVGGRWRQEEWAGVGGNAARGVAQTAKETNNEERKSADNRETDRVP